LQVDEGGQQTSQSLCVRQHTKGDKRRSHTRKVGVVFLHSAML